MSTQNNALEKEFELERMILFSDAVFAIAITLLIIEIKFPEVPKGVSTEEMIQLFKPVVIGFFAFVLSFFFIGVLWSRHLQFFKYVATYNSSVIFYNLLFLFFIVCFPFSASGLEHFRPSFMLPMYIYFVNIALVFLSQFLFCDYVFRRKKHLTKTGFEEEKSYLLLRSKFLAFALVITTVIVLVTAIVSHSNTTYTLWSMYTLPLMVIFIKRRLKKSRPSSLA